MDIRKKFIAHLYDALCRKGIKTYIDDELEIGVGISEALHKAIGDSRIAIIVLSQNYANSRWCLDELVNILKCKQKRQQKVLPVFYDVEPSEVRNQAGSVKEAFAKLEAKFMDDIKLQRWKRALKEVADLPGCHLQNRKETELIQEIIRKLGPIISNQSYLHVAKYPVGIESRVQQVNLLLSVETNDRRMVGIVGIGGIGKTTIAKAIYNSISYKFDGSCFLPDIRENCAKNGMVYLQKEILSRVIGNSSLGIDMVDRGITLISLALKSKKVLIVLDDVDQLIQLEKLVGELEWFGLGSRIIMTTRNKGLLTTHGVDLAFQMEGLNGDEALEFFSWNAFKSRKPYDDFVELTQEVVDYAGGIPLALKVIGSNLFGKNLHEWKIVFDKYKANLHGDIQKVLQVSYDGLDNEEQKIFLDIACFFKGYKLNYVSKILDKCGFFSDCGIQELLNKSLISISKHDCLEMHDLVQQMGREIVRLESCDDPGRRSRLWYHEDIRRVLRDNTGTNKIEGILMDLPKGEHIHLELDPKVFKKMKNLRLFLNYNATFSTTPNFLSNELRVLHWSGFPGDFWPSNFHGENLVELSMCRSNFTTCKTIQNFQNLVSLRFRECESLIEIPDLSMIPNLETFNLIDCESLEKIHPSIASFNKLVSLTFQNCPNLKTFWRSLKLRSLLRLIISKCPRLRHFPKIDCPMECLEDIKLSYNCIEELPSSWKLTHGLTFNLRGSTNVENLLNVIYSSQLKPSIESTNVCNVGRSFPMAPGCFSGFVDLDLSETDIVSLPMCIQDCCKLCFLNLSYCWKLTEISRLPSYLRRLDAIECVSLEKLRLDARDSPFFEVLHLSGCKVLEDLVNDVQSFIFNERQASEEEKHANNHARLDFSFPGYRIPHWFSYKKAIHGNSCETDIIDIPNLDEKIKGMAFCFVFRTKIAECDDYPNFWVDVICDGSKICSCRVGVLYFEWGNMCMLYKIFESFKMKGDGMQVCLQYLVHVPTLESWGVHLVTEHEEEVIDYMANPQEVGNILKDIDDNSDASDEGHLTSPQNW